jgi:hypothetical protein
MFARSATSLKNAPLPKDKSALALLDKDQTALKARKTTKSMPPISRDDLIH